MPQIYSGRVKANDGFASPAYFDGPSGWTVFKSHQTEIYEIRHNLHLDNPYKQLHVVLMSEQLNVGFEIEYAADSFTAIAWRTPEKAPVQTDFTFVAIHYPSS